MYVGQILAIATHGGPFLDRVFAWLIRWFCARKQPCARSWRTLFRPYRWVPSEVNHIAVYLGKGLIIEAVRRVVVSKAADYPDALWLTLPPELTPNAEQGEAIFQFLMKQRRKFYNVLDIFAIALAQKRFGNGLTVVSKWWWVKRLSSDRFYICSQLADAGYHAGGIELFPGRLPGLVSPQDITDLAVSSRTMTAADLVA